MSEKYVTTGACAVGTDKTIINIFNPAATPTCRGKIFDVVAGAGAAVADATTDFLLGRTTAVGTEGSGLVPNNIDPAGPAGAYDSGLGTYGGEPTYTAAKTCLAFSCHQRNTFRWVAREGCELIMTATQNNGAGIKSSSSTGTAVHRATIWFEE
jgi:hypothetical protein